MNRCQFFNQMVMQQCGQGLLPSAYQHVEYLQSSGTQYIDTARKVQSSNISVNIKLQRTSSSSSEMNALSNQDSSTNRFVFGVSNGNWFLYNRTSSSTYTNSTISADLNIAELEIYFNNNQKKLVKDGVETSWITASAITNNNKNLILLQAAVGGYGFVGRLYYFDYAEDNELVFKMIPCYRKSDDKPGMYDLVSKTFYTNSGTGEFTVGPAV